MAWSAADLGISIHPPLAGRDCRTYRRAGQFFHFNPPAPCGAGRMNQIPDSTITDFNPPAPCGAGQKPSTGIAEEINFNPPAPCGAGRRLGHFLPRFRHFNPPAPCGAGLVELCRSDPGDNFNPPAPCGAGRAGIQLRAVAGAISIHPPLVGRDVPVYSSVLSPEPFQSTRPLWGGTRRSAGS